jgi:hypothetical protein
MATLQDKVQGYVGTFADTGSLTSWLVQSVHRLIDALPTTKAELYSAPLLDGGSGVVLANYRVLRAHKLGYGASFVSPSFKARLADSGSVYRATNTSPKAYIENGTGFILPGGGSFIAFAYPALTHATVDNVSQFVIDYQDHIVLYVAIKCVHQNISTKIATIAALSFTAQSGITYDFASEIAQIETYVDTDNDFELATAKINEVNLRLNDIKTKLEASGLLISQEDKRLMDLIAKTSQEIVPLMGLLKELNTQYALLMGNL